MSEKKLLKVMLGLLMTVLLHNIYLNYEILQFNEDVKSIKRLTRSAEDYAIEAANNSREAKNAAREAASGAEEARYQASRAADAAFGNQCRYCP